MGRTSVCPHCGAEWHLLRNDSPAFDKLWNKVDPAFCPGCGERMGGAGGAASCGGVRREALLALADELDKGCLALQGPLETDSDFKVVMAASGALGDEIERHEIACRIREACGEDGR